MTPAQESLLDDLRTALCHSAGPGYRVRIFSNESPIVGDVFVDVWRLRAKRGEVVNHIDFLVGHRGGCYRITPRGGTQSVTKAVREAIRTRDIKHIYF